jgi:hypothetical protein
MNRGVRPAPWIKAAPTRREPADSAEDDLDKTVVARLVPAGGPGSATPAGGGMRVNRLMFNYPDAAGSGARSRPEEDEMPAVTTERLLDLPRVPVPDPQAVAPRRVRSITSAPQGFEGEGFPVYRAFAGVSKRTLDPFIHMDQMGEVEYAPASPRARRGTRTAASRPSPTCSTAPSCTRTRTAAAE